MKHSVVSILRWVDGIPPSAAVMEAAGSWGAHGGSSAAETPASYAARVSLSAAMPTAFISHVPSPEGPRSG